MPWVIPLIMVASAVASTAMAARAQNQAAGVAQAQSDLGFRQFAAQRQLQQQQQDLATAGDQDIYGNRKTYVPGVGWTVTPSPAVAAELSAEMGEKRKALTEDATNARAIRENAFRRQLELGQTADRGIARYNASPGRPLDQIQGALTLANIENRRAANTPASSDAAMQAVRQGITSSPIVNELMKRASLGSGADIANARLNAPQAMQQEAQGASQAFLNPALATGAAANSPLDNPQAPSQVPGLVGNSQNMARYVAGNDLAGASRSLALGAAGTNEGFGHLIGTVPDYGAQATGYGKASTDLLSLLADRYFPSKNSATGDVAYAGNPYTAKQSLDYNSPF